MLPDSTQFGGMCMKVVFITFALTLLLAVVSSATEEVDIKGYVYYQDYDSLYPPDTSCCLAFPIDSAVVTLYKRTDSSGWETFGSTVNTNSNGYYVLENIDIGDGSDDLCTYSDWFRVEVDASASGCLPSGWSHYDTLDRFSHNETRPDGIPDAGDIRVDFVFEGSDYTVYSGSSVGLAELMGHFVAEDDQSVFFATSNRAKFNATCPFERNEIESGSCLWGHFTNTAGFTAWSDEDSYSEYIFSYEFEGDSVYTEFAWSYTYWTLPWPIWATHYHRLQPFSKFICRDFVYLQPDVDDPIPFSSNDSSTELYNALQSWSNPSAQRAVIHYSLLEPCDVKLVIYDLTGRLVSVPAEGQHTTGQYTVSSGNLRSGVYLCRLEAGSTISTIKILIE